MKNLVKNATRHLVAKAYDTFAKNKKDISVISLPGDVWELENHIHSNRDFSFHFGDFYALDMVLAEKDETIYNRHYNCVRSVNPVNVNSYHVLSRYGVTYKNEVLNESHVKLCKSNNIFAWFDFCGNPTTQNLNLIKTAEGKTVTYIFTFNTAWRQDSNVDKDLLEIASANNKAVAIHCYLGAMAQRLGLTMIWSFEYVANHTPMISMCFSNDVNVISDKFLNIVKINMHKKNTITPRTNTPITKAVTVKRDLTAVYNDYKNKMDDSAICAKHNITRGTLYAVKAWVTMGK